MFKWVDCIGPEGKVGKLKPCLVNIAMKFLECDLLQQWKTLADISPISEITQIKRIVLRQILKSIIKNIH